MKIDRNKLYGLKLFKYTIDMFYCVRSSDKNDQTQLGFSKLQTDL